MGRLLFVSRTAYDKIEKGKSKLTVDYLMNIAEILRISPLDLIKPDNEYHVVISKEDYDTLMAASALLAKMHDQIVPIKTETVSIDNAGGTIGQINFGNQNALGETKEKVAKKKSKV